VPSVIRRLFLYAFANVNDRRREARVFGLSACSPVRPLAPISRGAIPPYFGGGISTKLGTDEFIMQMGIDETVFKVTGKRSRS